MVKLSVCSSIKKEEGTLLSTRTLYKRYITRTQRNKHRQERHVRCPHKGKVYDVGTSSASLGTLANINGLLKPHPFNAQLYFIMSTNTVLNIYLRIMHI